uniref:Uncharacterized protein n=1 Tax=Arundo donax TaxID=35708 RepID=A0A0A9GLA4_ARUDO
MGSIHRIHLLTRSMVCFSPRIGFHSIFLILS